MWLAVLIGWLDRQVSGGRQRGGQRVALHGEPDYRIPTCKIVSDVLVASGFLLGRLRDIRFKRMPMFPEPCDEPRLDRLDPAWPGYQNHECERGLFLQLPPDGAAGRLSKSDCHDRASCRNRRLLRRGFARRLRVAAVNIVGDLPDLLRRRRISRHSARGALKSEERDAGNAPYGAASYRSGSRALQFCEALAGQPWLLAMEG